MSEETKTKFESTQPQKTEENNSNNALDHNANEIAASNSQEAQSTIIDKTPISSVTTLDELHQNESKNIIGNESIEKTDPAEGLNETECIKFAEKFYKVFP